MSEHSFIFWRAHVKGDLSFGADVGATRVIEGRAGGNGFAGTGRWIERYGGICRSRRSGGDDEATAGAGDALLNWIDGQFSVQEFYDISTGKLKGTNRWTATGQMTGCRSRAGRQVCVAEAGCCTALVVLNCTVAVIMFALCQCGSNQNTNGRKAM